MTHTQKKGRKEQAKQEIRDHKRCQHIPLSVFNTESVTIIQLSIDTVGLRLTFGGLKG